MMRRSGSVFSALLFSFAAAGGAALADGAAAARTVPYAGPAIPVTVHQGTAFAFALSPDRSQVVMDLQGTLFVMPAAGGTAKAITDNLFDAREPSWSPDGRLIAFQSDRTGHWQIWVVGADGRHPRAVTAGIYEAKEPSWSPDGRRIAFTSDRDGKLDIWQIDLRSGAMTRITHAPGGNSRATWAPDGKAVVYVSDRQGAAGVYESNLAGVEHELYGAKVFGFGMTVPLGTPAFSPDGKKLLYTVIAAGRATLMMNGETVTRGEDVFPSRPQWVDDDTFLYAADGELKRRSLSSGAVSDVPFSATFVVRRPSYTKRRHDFDSSAPQPVVGIQRAVISPDGRQIAFAALGNLWLMPVGGEPRRLTDNGPYEVVDPAWSPDGREIVYACDRLGSFDLWRYDLATGHEKRLTSAPGAEMRPSWSPDGTRIAYANVFGSYVEQLEILDLNTGKSRTLDAAGTSIGYPAWSPDGKHIMVSRLADFSTAQSYYEGGENQIAIVPVDGGKATDVTLDKDWSIGDRSGDGPVWSPDGRWIAFRRAAALWIAPFTLEGEPAGKARKVSDDIVTSLSWAGDSRTLLGQAGGNLTLYTPATGAHRSVPMRLTWKQAKPRGLVTLHVGKLVDGVDRTARADMDIVIDGNRIVSVAPHGSAPVRGKLIDASHLTAMPGIMDMHEHLIKEFGSNFGRLMLAYGITTVRDPGDVPGDILEERESIDAGLRPGPRMFAAGYILDGERTVWEMGTSIRSKPEVDRVLAFDHRVGFDMVKSYVHTSEPLRQYIVEQSHRYGMIVSSHDFYPAAAWGSDSVEHLDGNGCSRGYCTKASQLDLAYDDVARILAASGMTITPTVSLFTPPNEFAQGDPTTASDPRNGLQPSWVRHGQEFSMGAGPGGDILIDNIRRSILKLYRAGVKIVAGTDSPFTTIGINTHNELQQEVRASLTPFEALQTATTIPAELLGVAHDLGTIEPGKLADIDLVEGDPLTDIRDAMKVREVMKNGRLYTVAELIRQGEGVAPKDGGQARNADAQRSDEQPAAASPAGAAAPEPTNAAADKGGGAQLSGGRPKLTPPAGMLVFMKTCSSCHTQKGIKMGGRIVPTIAALNALPPQQIYDALTTGKMQGEAASLTKQQKREVAEFLSGRTLVDRATVSAAGMPNRCPANPPFTDPASTPGWNGWSPTLNNARYQTAGGLDAADIPKLRLKWAFGLPDGASSYSQPSVVSGRVFVGSDNTALYSLDARTGCVYWSFIADSAGRYAPIVAPISGHRDAKYAVYFATGSNTVYAVNAQNGRLLWKTQLKGLHHVSGSAAYYEGRIYVPLAGTETVSGSNPRYPCCRSRGAVAAVDANTGRVIWQVSSIPEPLRKLDRNSVGTQLWGPSGASVWNTPTIDPKRRLIYVGTGNSYGPSAASTSDSVLALSMKDGHIVWHYQLFKNDAFMLGCADTSPPGGNCPPRIGHDWDFGGGSAILQHLPDGRDILVDAGKGGIAIGLDPDDGKLLWRTPLYGRTPPTADGLVIFGGAADGRRVYYPLQRAGGGLTAVELANGRIDWTAPLDTDGRGQIGAASAIPGVVLTGGWDGILRAVSTSGEVIWRYDTRRSFTTVNGVAAKGGSLGSPGPTIADGMVFVASGYIGMQNGSPGNVILAFAPE